MLRLTSLTAALAFALMCGFAAPDALATETDQFTLPPTPLDDLGPDLGAIVLDIIRAEVAQFNARIDERIQLDAKSAREPINEREFATHVYEQTGVGLPESTVERTLRYGAFPGRTVRFKPALADSIYAWVFAPFPLSHLMTDCPTIRLYGIDLGTDKIGHVFQQGYEYYNRYEDDLARGADEASAIAGAVSYGVLTEKGLYGIMLTGVYSNGDLAGNYAGLKFYRSLFHEVRIGDRTLAPLLRREGAHLVIDPQRDNAELMKPFITEHLSEAWNPSLYLFSVERIRAHVRDRCANWFRQVPDFDEVSYRAHLERSKTWFGEPYGWDLPATGAVTLLECFGPASGDSGSAPADRRPIAPPVS
jgi:hypothetical protein